MRARADVALRLAVVFVAIVVGAHAAAQSCPTHAPFGLSPVWTPVCDAGMSCSAGQVITFSVTWYSGSPIHGQPPQACDVVTWNFGDGTTATSSGTGTVTHAYAANGDYPVSITVTNSRGSGTFKGAKPIHIGPATCPLYAPSGLMTVSSPPCTAQAPCMTGQPVTFRLAAHPDGGKPPQSCDVAHWDFGEDAAGRYATAPATAPVTYVYREPSENRDGSPGGYTLRATIVNSRGMTGAGFQGLVVVGPCLDEEAPHGLRLVAPTCTVAAPCVPGTTQLAVNFELHVVTGVAHPYRFRACDTFVWDFGDGTSVTHKTPQTRTLQREQHVYSPGGYKASVTVTNGRGSVQFVTDVVIGYGLVGSSTKQVTAPHNATVASIPVVRSSGDNTISVTYTTSSARPGYVPISGSVTFAVGQTAKTLEVPVDSAPVVVKFSNPSPLWGFGPAFGYFSQTTVTPAAPPPPVAPSFSVGDVNVAEGSAASPASAQFVVRLSAPDPSGPNTIAMSTSDGTAKADANYKPTTATLLFPSGSTEKTFVVPLIGDDACSLNTTFSAIGTVIAGAAVARKMRGTATVIDDDPCPLVLVPAANAVARGQRVRVTLFVPLLSGGTVSVVSSDPSVIAVTGAVDVPAGSSSAELSAEAVGIGTASIIAIAPATLGGGTASAAIDSFEEQTVAAAPAQLSMSSGAAVPLSVWIAPGVAHGVTVSVESSDPAVVKVPERVVVSAGGKATVLVRAIAPGSATIVLTLPAEFGGRQGKVDVKVQPPRRRAARR